MGLPLIFMPMRKRKLIAIMVSLATLAVIMASCKTIKYIPMETVKWRDSVRTVERRDSIHVHDSVYVRQWEEGGTKRKDSVVVRYVWRDRNRTDTIIAYIRDSVPKPMPFTKEVIKYQLRWWQKPLVWLGGLTLIGLAVWWLVRARKRA